MNSEWNLKLLVRYEEEWSRTPTQYPREAERFCHKTGCVEASWRHRGLACNTTNITTAVNSSLKPRERKTWVYLKQHLTSQMCMGNEACTWQLWTTHWHGIHNTQCINVNELDGFSICCLVMWKWSLVVRWCDMAWNRVVSWWDHVSWEVSVWSSTKQLHA